jgi:hypothetical protein
MGGRCSFGFMSMHCASSGPVTYALFAIFAACMLSCFVFAALIDSALAKRHPQERDDVRLNVLSLYQLYAWRKRGRELGDAKLATLLDRYRLAQLIAYGTFALIALSAYIGV